MKALPHVLWIGGPPCSGKTSVSLLLAARNDLRVYNSDLHTWEHHDRAVERGWTDATFWQSASPDQAWLADPESILRHTLTGERGALPADARGPAWLVADRLGDRDRAVWLVPTPGFQRARLLERSRLSFERTSDPERALENRIRRELEVGELIERDARERGYHVVRVDGSRGIREVAGEVERLFAAAIGAGPRAETREARRELRRRHNRQVLQQVSAYFDRVAGAGDAAATPVPFGCECGTSGCLGETRVTLREAERAFAEEHGLLLDPLHR